MGEKVNLAVIGAGYWGRKLIREYIALSKKRSDLSLKAIVDKAKERLYKISVELGIPAEKLYINYDDILKNPKINAVHIATPNETHYKIAMEALERGKHVLLEKPMALTSREAYKLAQTSESKGLVLLVGHIYRFNNAVTKVKEIVEEGKLGEPYYMKLYWTTLMNKLPQNRDILFDLAPHPIDIVNYVLEEWPTKVYTQARSYIRGKKRLEEAAFSLGELPEGQTILIVLSWIQPGPKKREFILVGSKATVYVDALNQKITLYDNNRTLKQIHVQANNTIESMISHFIDRIINGNPPRSSALIGARTVSIIEAMQRSLNLGKPVYIT